MASYFESIGSKATTKSQEVFTDYDSDKNLLYKYYYHDEPEITRSQFEELDRMFKDWIKELFLGLRNIIIQQSSSSYALMCQFYESYLNSCSIPDYSCTSSKNGKSTLNIKTVMLHGRIPITEQEFCHNLMNSSRIKVKSAMMDDTLKLFVDDASEEKIHYVFMIHSLELLYCDSRSVFNIIFQNLIPLKHPYLHFITSMDKIDSIGMLDKGQTELRYVLYDCSKYGKPYIFEKLNFHSSNNMNDAIDKSAMDFQTLKDVYDALQKDCLKILVFIIEYMVRNSDTEEEVAPIKFGDAQLPAEQEFRRPKRRNTRKSHKHNSNILEFRVLMDFYSKEHMMRRTNVVRNHLDELIDHNIIKFGDSDDIICLVDRSTGKRFLEYIETLK